MTLVTHHESKVNRSLQLLLGADVAGSATLALAAVGGSGVETSVAPTTRGAQVSSLQATQLMEHTR